MNSYYSIEELKSIGLKAFGSNVFVSKKSSIYKPEVISLGNNVRIDDFCLLSGGAGIQIGNNIHISAYSAIYGGARVIFEDYTGLSPRCTVLSETDDFSGDSMVHPFFPKDFKPGFLSKKVVLRKFSQVGTNSLLLPGVELGEGAAIGAFSLVRDDCESWSIYAGVPAKYIKLRSKKLIDLEMLYRQQIKDES